MENKIKINNLSFGYGSSDILNNFSLEIHDGDFLCIAGENGSGKSTLMKCILNLNKNYTGTIDRPDVIGYLPQKTSIQSNFPASVMEVILSGTIINNPKKVFYTKEDKTKANKIMEDLDIVHLKKKCFRELSGGQQQRVLIARALCANSDVIILDEPVNGLDPSIVDQIYKLLYDLNKKGLTVIMVSHDIIRVKDYCSRVVEISNGVITYDGCPDDYNFGGMKHDDITRNA